jgi:hypothetical protein
MKSDRTRRCGAIRKAAVARNLLHFRHQIEPGHRQNGRVQNLANMASSLGTVSMRVKKRKPRRDIQKQHATQKGQRRPRESSRIES